MPCSQGAAATARQETGFSRIPTVRTIERWRLRPLLERRPDIRAAESSLAAANARIGVARAAWFPRLDLAATLGSGALDVGSLFSGPAALWQVGASVLAPALDFGRRRADVDTAEARRNIAELQDRAAVRNAFREVGDAWTLLDTANRRLEALNRQVAALDAGVAQAECRYVNGYSPFLKLLPSQSISCSMRQARSKKSCREITDIPCFLRLCW
jgi:multidrug efflux system outer membrane protein